MAGFLELQIQVILNGFPDGVAVGPDDHGAADRAVVGELSVGDYIEVPGIEVYRPGGHRPLRSRGWLSVRRLLRRRRRRSLLFGEALSGEPSAASAGERGGELANRWAEKGGRGGSDG